MKTLLYIDIAIFINENDIHMAKNSIRRQQIINGLRKLFTYDFKNKADLQTKVDSIVYGLNSFKTIFGFNSKSAIAPAAVWNNKIEEAYLHNEVNYIQSYNYQKESLLNNDLKIIFIFHVNLYTSIS